MDNCGMLFDHLMPAATTKRMCIHRSFLTATLLFMVCGCVAPFREVPAAATGTNSPKLLGPNSDRSSAPAYVTISIDNGEPEFVEWLRSNNVRVENDPDGDERIFDSSACHRILVLYRRTLRQRLDVIAENVASADVTRDARGGKSPYRRRYVTADKAGTYSIRDDPSPFQKRYEPGHPDADADGYVLYPNVEPAIEYVNALESSRQYDTVIEILQRFDSTYVDSNQARHITAIYASIPEALR